MREWIFGVNDTNFPTSVSVRTGYLWISSSKGTHVPFMSTSMGVLQICQFNGEHFLDWKEKREVVYVSLEGDTRSGDTPRVHFVPRFDCSKDYSVWTFNSKKKWRSPFISLEVLVLTCRNVISLVSHDTFTLSSRSGTDILPSPFLPKEPNQILYCLPRFHRSISLFTFLRRSSSFSFTLPDLYSYWCSGPLWRLLTTSCFGSSL